MHCSIVTLSYCNILHCALFIVTFSHCSIVPLLLCHIVTFCIVHCFIAIFSYCSMFLCSMILGSCVPGEAACQEKPSRWGRRDLAGDMAARGRKWDKAASLDPAGWREVSRAGAVNRAAPGYCGPGEGWDHSPTRQLFYNGAGGEGNSLTQRQLHSGREGRSRAGAVNRAAPSGRCGPGEGEENPPTQQLSGDDVSREENYREKPPARPVNKARSLGYCGPGKGRSHVPTRQLLHSKGGSEENCRSGIDGNWREKSPARAVNRARLSKYSEMEKGG